MFVRSYMAHARILGIDASAATELPGHPGVHRRRRRRSASIPPPPFIGIDERMFRPFLASERARFVGDIVAVVLS